MNRRSHLRVRPQVEALEERFTPSTLSNLPGTRQSVSLLGPLSVAGAPSSSIPTLNAPGDLIGAITDSAPAGLQTHVVPFAVIGQGTAPQGLPLFPGGTGPHNAAGWSNLTGAYGGDGLFTLLNFTGPNTGNFHGNFDFVAGNGDQLACDYGAASPGTFTTYPANDHKVVVQFVAVFTPNPGASTGRFADIIGGSFTMVATTEAFDPTPNAQGFTQPFAYHWEGEGLFVERAGQGSAHTSPVAPVVGPQSSLVTVPQIAPLEVFGGGTAPQGLPLFPGGAAPHNAAGSIGLWGDYGGRYSGDGQFTLLNFTSAATGNFQGNFDFVVNNGDQLACNYGADSPGTFTIFPAANGKVIVQFVAVFTPVPGASTGRFANVIGGSFTMIATSEAFDPTPNAQGYTMPFAYSWEGEGLFLEQPGQSTSDSSLRNAANILHGDPQGQIPADLGQTLGAMLLGTDKSMLPAAVVDKPAISKQPSLVLVSLNPPAMPAGGSPIYPSQWSGHPEDVDALFIAWNDTTELPAN